MELDNNIEYRLKFLLDSMTLKHIETKDILDQAKMKEFNDTFKDEQKVQVFCSKLEASTYFPVLSVPFKNGETIHTVYLCEVALGNTIYVDSEYVKNNLPIPQGFDAFVTNINSNKSYLHETQIDLKEYVYVINDSTRILPIYEITFEYDPEFEKSARNKNVCHKCLNEEAIMYCPSERAIFCSQCDELVHSDAFLKRHERKYFDKCGQKKFINCKEHITKTIEFYCTDCSMPICSYCKVNGSHSKGDFASHNIITFLEACNTLSTYIQEAGIDLVNLSSNIENEVQKYIDLAEKSRKNIADLYEKLEEERKNLRLQLENIEETKKQRFNAGYIEICKQGELFKRMREFPAELDPTDRLQYYSGIINYSLYSGIDTDKNSVGIYLDQNNEVVKFEGNVSIKVVENQKDFRNLNNKEKEEEAE